MCVTTEPVLVLAFARTESERARERERERAREKEREEGREGGLPEEELPCGVMRRQDYSV